MSARKSTTKTNMLSLSISNSYFYDDILDFKARISKVLIRSPLISICIWATLFFEAMKGSENLLPCFFSSIYIKYLNMCDNFKGFIIFVVIDGDDFLL